MNQSGDVYFSVVLTKYLRRVPLEVEEVYRLFMKRRHEIYIQDTESMTSVFD